MALEEQVGTSHKLSRDTSLVQFWHLAVLSFKGDSVQAFAFIPRYRTATTNLREYPFQLLFSHTNLTYLGTYIQRTAVNQSKHPSRPDTDPSNR